MRGIRGIHEIRAIHGVSNRNLSQLSLIFRNLEMAGVLLHLRLAATWHDESLQQEGQH